VSFATYKVKLDNQDEVISLPGELVLPKSYNELGDDVWFFIDEKTSKNDVDDLMSYKWRTFDGVGEHLNRVAQEYIQTKYPKRNMKGLIFARASTLKGDLRELRLLLNAVKELKPEGLLRDITLQEWKLIAQKGIVKSDSSLYSRWSGATMVTELRLLEEYYRLGKISDGVGCILPSNVTSFFYRELFINEREYAEWLEGGSWARLPGSVAIALLADLLEDMVKMPVGFLLEYFEAQRSEMKAPPYKVFHREVFGKLIKKSLGQSVVERRKSDYAIDDYKHKAILDVFVRHNKALNDLIGVDIPSMAQLSNWCYEYKRKALLATTLLSGIRVSEVASIRCDGFSTQSNGNCYFLSAVEKTHDGMRVKRSISGLVKEMVENCYNMSYLTDRSHIPPFAGTHTFGCFDDKKTYVLMSESYMRNVMSKLYQEWLGKGRYVGDKVPDSLSPHNLRHCFVEVALRRFNSNEKKPISRSVLRLIQDHLKHSYDSNFTHRYTNGKYDEELWRIAEQEYIREIVTEMAEGSEDYTGPVARKIKRIIGDTHKITTLKQMDEVIEETLKHFERITVHEYGFCVPDKRELARGECKDPDTGELRTTEGACIKNCSKCVHRLTPESALETIERIAISHSTFIDASALKSITRASSEVVAQCKVILDEANYQKGDSNE
jgi:hypothetical protein